MHDNCWRPRWDFNIACRWLNKLSNINQLILCVKLNYIFNKYIIFLKISLFFKSKTSDIFCQFIFRAIILIIYIIFFHLFLYISIEKSKHIPQWIHTRKLNVDRASIMLRSRCESVGASHVKTWREEGASRLSKWKSRIVAVRHSVAPRSPHWAFHVVFCIIFRDQPWTFDSQCTFLGENVWNGAMCYVLVIPLDLKRSDYIGRSEGANRISVDYW